MCFIKCDSKYFKLQNTDDNIFAVIAAAAELVIGRNYEFSFDAKLHCGYDGVLTGNTDSGGGLDSMEIAVWNYLTCYGGLHDHVTTKINYDLTNIDYIELKQVHELNHHTGYDSDGEMTGLEMEITSLVFDLDNMRADVEYRPKYTPEYVIS